MYRYICIEWELGECPVGDLLRVEDGEKYIDCIKKFFRGILQADDPNYKYADKDVEDYCLSSVKRYFIVELAVAEKLAEVTEPNWGSLSTEDFDIACHSMMLSICSEFRVSDSVELDWE